MVNDCVPDGCEILGDNHRQPCQKQQVEVGYVMTLVALVVSMLGHQNYCTRILDHYSPHFEPKHHGSHGMRQAG